MAIGERIRFLRTLRGMTQKYLGLSVGFPERSADVRLAQYETGARTPKADLTEALAQALAVSPRALDVPNIDGMIGIAHTLFTLEDTHGLTVTRENGLPCLRPNVSYTVNQGDKQKLSKTHELLDLLIAWDEMATYYRNGQISREEYDQWRYCFPRYATVDEVRKRNERIRAQEVQRGVFDDSDETEHR